MWVKSWLRLEFYIISDVTGLPLWSLGLEDHENARSEEQRFVHVQQKKGGLDCRLRSSLALEILANGQKWRPETGTVHNLRC